MFYGFLTSLQLKSAKVLFNFALLKILKVYCLYIAGILKILKRPLMDEQKTFKNDEDCAVSVDAVRGSLDVFYTMYWPLENYNFLLFVSKV